MKNMKNRVAALLLLALTIALLTSCGGKGFDITGKWKNVGDTSYGQAQPGAIVAFSGANCNFLSPQDTYAIYEEDGQYHLDITGLLGGGGSFTVEIIDNDNILVKNVTLKRVS
ncbi:MAG: hypothetical protein LBT36_00270 [Oscillospiraceae bacterium]|jgi:hypothetical protein|nr:hypothetical protein [Oscillospiraceae bacterium]